MVVCILVLKEDRTLVNDAPLVPKEASTINSVEEAVEAGESVMALPFLV